VKLARSITLLTDLLHEYKLEGAVEIPQALNLGIASLQRHQKTTQSLPPGTVKPLPGETKETTDANNTTRSH
jgi:hypothetical protein